MFPSLKYSGVLIARFLILEPDFFFLLPILRFVILLTLSCHLIFDLLLFLHCVVAVVVYFFGDFNFNILSTRTPSYIPLVLLWFLLYGLSFPGTDNLWRIRNLPILATHDYSDIYLQFCICDENFFL